MLSDLATALSRVERVVDRSIAHTRRRFGLWRDVHVLAYHAYGRGDRVRVRGRVLDDREVDHEGGLSAWDNVRLSARRFVSDEVPGATVELHIGGTTLRTETDEDGYFDVELRTQRPFGDTLRHRGEARLVEPGGPDRDEVLVQVPPSGARFAVISDLDDTVVRSHAPNKLRFAATVLLNNATTREVFPGVGALYRALVDEAGVPTNPIFYVSSSPWNLYRQFVGTLEHRDVPPGPLFLKDFGIDPGKFIKSGHHGHKLARIGELLAFYPDLDVVLIGDSGQQDPEIYQQVVARHPGRVRAVFIRDVTAPERDRAVHHIARDVQMRGVPMHLVADTAEAAGHAAELGLLEAGEIETVRAAAARESSGGE